MPHIIMAQSDVAIVAQRMCRLAQLNSLVFVGFECANSGVIARSLCKVSDYN